jgi:hypothetical protein
MYFPIGKFLTNRAYFMPAFLIYHSFKGFLPTMVEPKVGANIICRNIIGLSTLLKSRGQCSTFPGIYSHVVVVMYASASSAKKEFIPLSCGKYLQGNPALFYTKMLA